MFKTLNDRVLIKPEKASPNRLGVVLVKNIEEKPVIGIVVVGNNKVNKGDKVLFSKFGYDEVELDGELHYVVSDYLILGIF